MHPIPLPFVHLMTTKSRVRFRKRRSFSVRAGLATGLAGGAAGGGGAAASAKAPAKCASLEGERTVNDELWKGERTVKDEL